MAASANSTPYLHTRESHLSTHPKFTGLVWKNKEKGGGEEMLAVLHSSCPMFYFIIVIYLTLKGPLGALQKGGGDIFLNTKTKKKIESCTNTRAILLQDPRTGAQKMYLYKYKKHARTKFTHTRAQNTVAVVEF